MWNISIGTLITIHTLKKLHCKFIILELEVFCLNTLLSYTVYRFGPDNSNKIDP